MEWLIENWIGLGTLVAVTIGAVAALWTALETKRLASLQKQAMAFPEPAIAATCKFYPGRPDVANFRLRIRNLANIEMEITALRCQAFGAIRFHPLAVTGMGETTGGDASMDHPERWQRTVPVHWTVGATGMSRDQLYVMGHIHVRPLPFLGRRPLVIVLEMRWRDHAVTRFSRAITVTPNRTK